MRRARSPFGWSFVARLMLMPAGLLGPVRARLVTRYDLEEAVGAAAAEPVDGRVRDLVVACGDRLARALAPRGSRMSAPRVLVVVPAHNEEESLPGRRSPRLRRRPGVHVLVVDDGSQRRHRARRASAGVPVVRHPVNLGVGGALQTGFRYAVEHGYDVGVQLDADGQHDPARSRGAARAGPGEGACDVVIGSRYVAADRLSRAARPAARHAAVLGDGAAARCRPAASPTPRRASAPTRAR